MTAPDLIVRFFSCMSVLVVAAAAVGTLDAWFARNPRWRSVGVGLILGSVGLLSMADPVRTGGGLFFDARHVVVMLSAPVGGPAATLVAGALLAAMRWWIGGPVAIAAVLAIAGSAAASIAWRLWAGELRTSRDVHGLALLSGIVPTLISLATLAAGPGIAPEAWLTIELSVVFNALGVETIGHLMLWHRERGENLEAFRQSESRLDSIARNARGALFRLRLDEGGMPDLEQISHVFPPIGLRDGAPCVPGTQDDLDAFRDVLQASRARNAPFVFERCYGGGPGQDFWIRWQATPQVLPDGAVVWDGFVSDVTERMQVKLQLEHERRSTMMQVLRDFEARVASAVRLFATTSQRLQEDAAVMQEAASGSVERTRQASDKARLVAAFVHDVAGKVGDLDSRVREATSQIVGVAGRATETSERIAQAEAGIQQLSAACEQIGTIAGFIQGVAAQTNLLALNATIEAARAGESGRGFAVVAGEVKDLAAQITRATSEVSSKLSGIRVASENAVTAMEQIRRIAQGMQRLAEDTRRTATEHSCVVEEISSTSAELSTDATLLTRDMDAAAAGATDTGQIALNLHILAGSISRETHRLVEEIEAFGRKVAAGAEGRRDVEDESVLLGSEPALRASA